MVNLIDVIRSILFFPLSISKATMKSSRQIWLLTIKNLRLLLRSRASALIIVFAPLVIILLIGLSYNNSAQFGLNIGIAVDSFTEDVESFITLLEEEEFTIYRYESKLDDCIADIKSSTVHTCITLPESLLVEDNNQKEIVFYIDPSRINLVWMIQNTVQKKFSIKSQEISQNLAQGVLGQLTDTKDTISQKILELDSIKERTGSASGSTEEIRTNLEEVDLTGESYEDSNINQDLQDSRDLISDVLGSISSAVSNENIRTEMLSKLNEAKDTLYGKDSDDETIQGIIGVLQAGLDSAITAISSAGSDLNEVVETLNGLVTDIDSVQADLNIIYENLEGQKVTDADTLASPLTTKIERVSPESTYLNYLFPALLVMVVMFSSLLLGTTLVMIEKNSPAFLRNFFLPVRKIIFVTSIYITTLILILTEISIILGISLFFLKDSLPLFPAVAFVLFITASVFTFLGMAIGYVFTSEETGVLASISLGSVFLFISGVILPLEGISPLLRKVTHFNPFVIAEKVVREIFIFNSSFSALKADLSLLVGYAVILFIIILIIESFLHEHIIHKLLKHHQRVKGKAKEEKNA